MYRITSVLQQKTASSVRWQLVLLTACRLVLNTARRFAYPFAPVLSRGLAVPLTAITSLIAVNQATTILGVFVGPIADYFGFQVIMLTGLGILAAGMLAASLFPYYGVVLLALFCAGLGKALFDPAVQSYVSELVPFQRRGRAIGILESAWAGSTLISIPLLAVFIKYFGWKAPFWVLCGTGLCSIVILYSFPSQKKKTVIRTHATTDFLKTLLQLVKQRPALGMLGFSFFAGLASDNLFMVYGAWLEHAFALNIVAIGFGTSVIGIAELLGESLTATLADKFSLKRSLLVGLTLSTVSYGILPLLGRTLPLALGSLFLVFLSNEFTIVVSLSLCTELLPESRATMMPGFLAASGLGRISGAVIGGMVWLRSGIFANSVVAVVASSLALVCLGWGLWDWQQK